MSNQKQAPHARSLRPNAKDYFDVIYAGLACFRKGDRVVLMPDGTNPTDATVPPHFAYIVVDPGGVIQTAGWTPNSFTQSGVYALDKCQIDITAATAAGQLDATQHDSYITPLTQADASFKPSASPNTIVRTSVGSGTLTLFRRPGASSGDNYATISQLRVPYAGQITVSVKFDSEASARSLILHPFTDIAIANIAFPRDSSKKGNDFLIYGQLAWTGTIKPPKNPKAPKVPVLKPDYQLFRLGLPVGDGGAGCGNQGCCPPP